MAPPKIQLLFLLPLTSPSALRHLSVLLTLQATADVDSSDPTAATDPRLAPAEPPKSTAALVKSSVNDPAFFASAEPSVDSSVPAAPLEHNAAELSVNLKSLALLPESPVLLLEKRELLFKSPGLLLGRSASATQTTSGVGSSHLLLHYLPLSVFRSQSTIP